jgi:DNA-binding winged helix-turn-helix (wHTH) protein
MSFVYKFEDYCLDSDRRELRRGADLVTVEPQVFDLLEYLIRNRDRIVGKDDLIAGVWNGRIVSDSTLSSRITATRQAIGDNGEQQRLIRTISRKGFRFVGVVSHAQETRDESIAKSALSAGYVAALPKSEVVPLPLPDKPSIAVLPFANLSGDPKQEYFVANTALVGGLRSASNDFNWSRAI